jgi:hypothetical protein
MENVLFHFAMRYGHPEIAKVLLECGAATNLRSINRQTPLKLCEQVAVAGFSTALLQKHEQSPQGAYASMLEEVVGPNLSPWVGAKSNDARSDTSSSSKASAASTWSAASVVSASTPPMPAASPKSSGSAPRAQVATANKNRFGILAVQEDDEKAS